MKQRVLFFVLCSVLMSVLLAACGSTDNNTGTKTSTSAPTATPAATVGVSSHFHVGDEVTVGSTWKVVVNSIKSNPGDGQVYIPKNGVYVIVNVTLHNVSNAEQTISSFANFTMKGIDGTRYDETFASGLAGVSSAPDGKVEAGGLLKGDFIYDVPTSATKFIFAFVPDAFSGGQTLWDLSL